MAYDFDGLLSPRSIAVVGIGSNPDGPARRVVSNLQSLGFDGGIYPVNPKHESILDLECYPSLEAIDASIDLAVIAVPAAQVIDVVRKGAEGGIKNYIILSSGFGEIGEKGRALEAELKSLAKRHGLTIMGPNCSGSINFHERKHLSFTAVLDADAFLPGPVAYIGQSGAIGAIFYSLAVKHNVGFSHLISSGNEGSLDLTDYLEYLIADPNTQIMVAYAEQIKNGRRLLELGKQARAAGKHIVVFKSGRAGAGARAAISHTGSMAANDAICSSLFRRSGIVKVRTLEELLAVCKLLLAKRALPAGRRAALLAISGGSAVMAADLAEESGFTVPSLSPDTRLRLREWLPEFASFDNPIDVTSGLFYQPEKFAKVLECLVADPGIDFVVILGAYEHRIAQRLAEDSAPVLAACQKYSAAAWIAGGPKVGKHFVDNGIPYFDNLDQCFAGLNLLVPEANSAGGSVQAKGGAAEAAAPQGSRQVLTEDQVKAKLKSFGVPVQNEEMCSTAKEAAAAAATLGFPVAMKIISSDVPHRAKVGGIALGLHSEEAVAAEFGKMIARVTERVPGAKIDGVLLQKMVPPGPELFLGMSHDPSFGRVFTFGLGGILTEALQQIAFAPLPLSIDDARALVKEVPAVRTLLSFNPGAEDALAALISRIGDWCISEGEALEELDLNPIMLDDGKPVLIDGLAVVQSAEAVPTPDLVCS